MIDHRGFEEYLSYEKAKQYEDGYESEIGSNEGFFGDFAYTNVCKYQAPGDKVRPEEYDPEWLHEELEAVKPKIIFSLGNPAIEALQKIGFKQVPECEYIHKKEGRIYEYSGEKNALCNARVIQLYHLNYYDTKYGEVVHGALKDVLQKHSNLEPHPKLTLDEN